MKNYDRSRNGSSDSVRRGQGLVWSGAVISILADVKIIMVTAVVIDLEFAVPVSYSVGMLSDVVVDVLIDALTNIFSGVAISVVTDNGVGGLLDVNAKCVVMTAWEFGSSPAPL